MGLLKGVMVELSKEIMEMHGFDVMWVELMSLDGFYSHTPGETPIIAMGTHLREGSPDYWRVFLGLLGVHHSLSEARRAYPHMAFCPKLSQTIKIEVL